MKRVLITGSSGFLGSNLIKRIQKKNEIVTLKSDLLDLDGLSSEISGFGNTISTCFHFAGISSVPECEKNISRAYMINTSGALVLAELLAKNSPDTHFIFPSTGQIYGASVLGGTLDEDSPQDLTNIYVRTKRLAELGLENLAAKKNINITVLRMFNHSHKSQDSRFFLPSVYQQILKAKNDNCKKIVLGDLDIIRDIGTINDLLNAFEKVLNKEQDSRYQVYNVCSGIGKVLRTIVEEMINRLDKSIQIEFDPQLVRAGEPKIVCGCPKKLSETFDWHPEGAATVSSLVDAFLSDVQ